MENLLLQFGIFLRGVQPPHTVSEHDVIPNRRCFESLLPSLFTGPQLLHHDVVKAHLRPENFERVAAYLRVPFRSVSIRQRKGRLGRTSTLMSNNPKGVLFISLARRGIVAMAARVALEQVYDFDDTDGCQKDEAVLRRIAGITNIPEAEFSVWRE